MKNKLDVLWEIKKDEEKKHKKLINFENSTKDR